MSPTTRFVKSPDRVLRIIVRKIALYFDTFTCFQVHKLCQESADRILNDLRPNLMVAIGGGGYVPARILRSFLSRPGAPNIPIQAIGLSLYEKLPSSGGAVDNNSAAKADTDVEQPGTKVTRTQWLDLSSLEMANLIGKHVLIVDEVDDTRTTLEYAVNELKKDVEAARVMKGAGEQEGKTTFSIFVLHVCLAGPSPFVYVKLTMP